MIDGEERKTILLAEDDAIIAFAEAKALQKYGYQVITVYSGEQAVEAIEKSPEIDLALMDINFGGGMDGTQAAELILKQRDLPLIFLSSHAERAVVEKTDGITSYGYIVKNAGETVLIASIKMAFRLFEARMKEKEKDAALQAEHDRAQRYLDMAGVIFIAIGVDQRISLISRRGCEILGYDEAEIVGRNWFDTCIPERLRDTVKTVFTQMLNGEIAVVEYYENPVITKNGEEHLIAWRNTLLTDADGSITGTFSAGEDITERKQVEAALRESEERYRLLVDTANEGIWAIDKDHLTTYVNHAIADMLGYAPAEMLGKKVEDFFFPEDLSSHQERMKKRQAGGDEVYERRLKRRDGSPLWTLASAKSIQDEQGRFLGSFATLTDITERKQGEETLREKEALYHQMFAAHSAVMLLIDPESGEIVDANLAASQFYGYSIETLRQMNITQINTLAPERVTQARQEALSRRQSTFEFQHRLAGGELRDVEVRSVPVLTGGRRLLYSIIHDITDRKQAEEALKKALQEKQALLRELQHRAKNSFAMIAGLIDLTTNANPSDEAKAALTEIGVRVRAMSELYNLLYTTQAVSEVQLDEYCARVARSFFSSGNVRFEETYERVIAPVKLAAPIGLILTELITNAIKHAFPGDRGGTITIWLIKIADGALIGVEDDGVGFPEEFDMAASDSLGLTMVQALTRQIAGRFRMECVGGTRCVVEFPMQDMNG